MTADQATMHLPGGCHVVRVAWDIVQRADRKLVTIEGDCLPPTNDGELLPEITLTDLYEAVRRGNATAAEFLKK